MPLRLKCIDNIYAIALVGGKYGYSKEKWDSFEDGINTFGILKWNDEDLSLSVIFSRSRINNRRWKYFIQNIPEAAQPIPVHTYAQI